MNSLEKCVSDKKSVEQNQSLLLQLNKFTSSNVIRVTSHLQKNKPC